jgi:nucleotide-binding universal stress UspA family protein
MLPIKRMLCPTDFSKPSFKALDVAIELAGDFSAELVLLHVLHPIAIVPSPPPVNFNVRGYQRAAEVHTLKSLEKLALKGTSSRVKVKAKVLIGTAAQGIADAALKENADLIVIATHGETGWQRFVFGSVTEKVIRITEKPVLTIPASPE